MAQAPAEDRHASENGDRLRFEKVLYDLARAQRDNFEESIRAILTSVAGSLRVTRVGLWFFDPGKGSMRQTLLLDRGEFSTPGTCVKEADYPRYFRALHAWRHIRAPDARNDSRTSEFAEGYLRPLRIASLLDVPIWRDGEVVGILCNEHVGSLRNWTDEEAAFAMAISDMVSLALEGDALRRAKTLAQERAQALTAVLDNMVDSVLAMDTAGRVTLLNRAGRLLLGLPIEGPVTNEQIEAQLGPVKLPDGSTPERDRLPGARALRGETVLNEDILVTVRGGERHFRTSASPLRAPDGSVTGLVAVWRDITELEELNRLKDQFLRVAAHELRTPIAVMRGYAQALTGRLVKGEPVTAASLQAIVQGADRMGRLVTDLLDALKLQSMNTRYVLDVKPFDAEELLREVVSEQAVTTSRHALKYRQGEPSIIAGDRLRLRQALGNLLQNAVKYSPEGGAINVETDVIEGIWRVTVSDRGVGIPAEKMEHLFQPFYRAHTDTPHDFGGLGIGLFITRQIVRQHGGDVQVAAREGGGTRFTVEIPAVSNEAPGQ